MTAYYECHLTIEEGSAIQGAPLSRYEWQNGAIRQAVEEIGWVYSAIANDIDLGPGTKHYATKHFHIDLEAGAVITALGVARQMLETARCHVVRAKVENVFYDARIGRDF